MFTFDKKQGMILQLFLLGILGLVMGKTKEERLEAFAEKLKSIILKRGADYGDSDVMLEKIAKRWSTIIEAEITPEQVAFCLLDLKIVRSAANPGHEDSVLDAAGYVFLRYLLLSGEKRMSDEEIMLQEEPALKKSYTPGVL